MSSPPVAVWEPLEDLEAQRALALELEAWRGTAYGVGQQCRGVAADCVRFVCGVLDALRGTKTPLKTLPPDTCFHDSAKAVAGMERIRALFAPTDEVTNGVIQPGDVIVTGPAGAGPSHAMIVGTDPNTAWHCAALGGRGGVTVTGIRGVYVLGHRIFMVYRLRERSWRAA